jgi:hypothetical protein
MPRVAESVPDFLSWGSRRVQDRTTASAVPFQGCLQLGGCHQAEVPWVCNAAFRLAEGFQVGN